jgi:hypothetical protein
VSPVKYELGFYIPEDGILHSDRRVSITYGIVVLCGSLATAAKLHLHSNRDRARSYRCEGLSFLSAATYVLPANWEH